MDLYGGQDPRHKPQYTYADAARATDVPASTVRSWVVGQPYSWGEGQEGYFEPLIERPDENDRRLSFVNLVEVHVLRALRTGHDVPLQTVRTAIQIAEEELGIDRLLVSRRLKTGARKLFLDRYSDLVELSPSRQIAMRSILNQYLERVEWDEADLPVWFFPFSRSPENRGRKIIAVNPFISFGRPLLKDSGVSTSAISQRIDDGEHPSVVMEDYDISEAELEEALLYEQAA